MELQQPSALTDHDRAQALEALGEPLTEVSSHAIGEPKLVTITQTLLLQLAITNRHVMHVIDRQSRSVFV